MKPQASAAASSWKHVTSFTTAALCILGPYNGMNALGGGGLARAGLASQMNAFYSFVVFVMGWFGAVVFAKIGARAAMGIAACCYMSYLLFLICIHFYGYPVGLAYLGGILMGVGASLLWAVFGVTAIKIPKPENQRKVFVLMWTCINISGSICALVSLATNWNNEIREDTTLRTYWSLLGVMCLGLIVSLSSLRGSVTKSPPSEADGGCSSLSCLFNSQKPLLFLLFLTPFIHAPFLFNGVNRCLFNVRSRSLNSSLYWSSRCVGGLLYFAISQQLLVSLSLVIGGLLTFLWAAASLVVSHLVVSSHQFCSSQSPVLDFMEMPQAALPMSLFVFFGVLDAFVQSFIYGLLGWISRTSSLKEAAFNTGVYKSLQSLGVCVLWSLEWLCDTHRSPSWGLFSDSQQQYMFHCILITVVWLLASPGVVFHSRQLVFVTPGGPDPILPIK